MIRADLTGALIGTLVLGMSGLVVATISTWGPSVLTGCRLSWLLVFLISSGALGLDLLFLLCGCNWHVVLRRPLQSLHAPLMLLGPMLVPLSLAMDPQEGIGPHGFWRSAGWAAMLVLMLLSLRLRGFARLFEQGQLTKSSQAAEVRWAAAGMPLYALSLIVLSWQYLLVGSSPYASTIFPVIAWTVASLAASAAWAILVTLPGKPLAAGMSHEHRIALGRLMLLFASFGMYVEGCQYLITIMADKPDESRWFLPRLAGGWGWLASLGASLGYAVPWLALLSRQVQERRTKLLSVAVVLLLGRCAELVWLLQPSSSTGLLADLACALLGVMALGSASALYARWCWGPALLPAAEEHPRWRASLAYDARLA